MKVHFLSLSILCCLFFNPLAQAVIPAEISLCPEMKKQTAQNEQKRDNMAAAVYVTSKYPDILGALNKLEKNANGSKNTICATAVVISVNNNFPGASKYVYLFKFEVRQKGRLKAVVPVLMYDTSVQGHENGKNAFPLKNLFVIETLDALASNHPTEETLSLSQHPLSPGFVSELQKTSVGKNIIKPETAYVMLLGETSHQQSYLVTGFQLIKGMNESRTAPFGLLVTVNKRDQTLTYNNSVSVVRDLESPLANFVINEKRPKELEKAIDLIVEDSADIF